PGSPCYRCLFAGEEPVQPGNEVVAGPFGAVAGILGCIQSAEVIKYITGIGRLLTGRLLRFDALTMEFSTFNIPAYNRCRCRQPLK
ncbi:ThiF family adenylyltransferase, partial [uncultured Muribaculum sp.]